MFKVDIQPAEKRQFIEVYDDGNIHTLLEEAPIGVLIHCTIKEWNRETKDITHLVLYEICQELSRKGVEVLFALAPADDKKFKKYIAQYGFQYLMYGEDQDDKGLELWGLTTNIGEAQ